MYLHIFAQTTIVPVITLFSKISSTLLYNYKQRGTHFKGTLPTVLLRLQYALEEAGNYLLSKKS